VTSIGSAVFSGCSGLEEITLPFVGGSVKTSSDTYQYPFGYIFGTSSYTGGVATYQPYSSGGSGYGYSTYYIPKNLETVTITGGNILYGAFYECSSLNSIEIPDDVTSIGNVAFYNCSSLNSIEIPDDVTSIGDYAFQNCSSLTFIEIPNSVTSIGSGAFYNCSSLTSIEIPNSVTSIGGNAFYNCSSLASVEIPDSVTSIGNYAFYNCSDLTSIEIPDSVTSIGSDVFSSCSGLEEITLPFVGGSVKTSSDTYQYPFGYIFGTSSYTGGIATSQTYYTSKKSSYYGNSFNSTTNTYYLPEALHAVTITGGNILYGAFQNCSGLEYIVLPDTISTIGVSAFENCTGLTDVFWLGDGRLSVSTSSGNNYFSSAYWHHVEQFGELVTFQCTDAEIPNGTISYPGKLALKGETISVTVTPDTGYRLSKLTVDNGTAVDNLVTVAANGSFTSVTVSGSFEQVAADKELVNSGTCGEDIKWYLYEDGELFITGHGNMADYISSAQTPWSNYLSLIPKVTIDSGVTDIGNYAFKDLTVLTDVTIPASVTVIGDSAFEGCTSLEEIRISNGVKSIGSRAFANCSALETVVFSENLKGIGKEAFMNSGLTAAALPEGLGYIGEKAFASCADLSSVDIPDTVDDFDSNVFSGSTLLTTAGPSDSSSHIRFGWTEAIPANAFSGSTLEEILLPDSIETIGSYAFYNTNLTEMISDGAVQTVGDYAFASCEALAAVSLGNDVETIGTHAFEGCTALSEAILGNQVQSIGSDAFSGCTALEDIELPASLTTLEGAAFRGAGLTSITIPNQITTLSDSLFNGCESLETVIIPDSVTAIGSSTFYGCTAMEEIELPADLESIGSRAFYGCTALTGIALPDDVETVASQAFYGCSALETAVLSDQLTELGTYAFQNCTSLEEIILPDSLTSIGNSAFSGCTELAFVQLPDGDAAYGQNIFYNCYKLVTLGPAGSGCTMEYPWTASVPANAMHGCNYLQHVTITVGLKTINANAFYGCTALDEVYYIGTAIKWQTIDFTSNNADLTNADIHYVTSLDKVFHLTFVQPEHANIRADRYQGLAGDTVTVVCDPEPGYRLGGVYVDGVLLEADTFTMTSDHTVSAEIIFYDEAVASGTCGTNLKWCLYENGELYITGTGDMTDYSYTSIGGTYYTTAPWKDHVSSVQSVVIGHGVTSVGSYAFYNCDAISSVELPESITTLDSHAFDDCDGLTSVRLPDQLTTIGSYAFRYCRKLKSIVIPNSVTTINYDAFYYCYALTTVTVGSSVESIGSDAFYECNNISKVYYIGTEEGWNGISIGSRNTSLTNAERFYVNSMDDVYTITVGAVENGSVTVSRTECVNGMTVTVTAKPAEEYQLTHILVDGTPIEGNSFTVTGNHVVTAEFERIYYSITVVACENGSLQVDKESAVKGETVTVTAIPDEGYQLGTVFVNGADQQGTTFTVEGTSVVSAIFVTDEEIVASGKDGTSIYWYLYDNGTLYITGSGAMSDYSNTSWATHRTQVKSVIISDGITSIGDYNFSDYDSLTSISIGNSVTEIGSYAFQDCDALTTAVIPNNVISIGNNAFYGCNTLTTLDLGSGVQTIGYEAFRNCYTLTELVIPASVNSIGYRAFAGNSYGFYPSYSYYKIISSVEFMGDAPTEFGSSVFGNETDAGEFLIYYHTGTTGWTTPTWNGYYTVCIEDSLSEFSALDADCCNSQGIVFTLNDESNTAVVGTNTTSVNNSGYYGNSNGAVTIPDVVTKDGKTYKVIGIGQNAFSSNQHIKMIKLGANISSVDPTAFRNCPFFTAFTVDAANTQYSADNGILYDVAKYYLYSYPSGKSGSQYTVPSSVKTIGTGAFYGNKNLTEVVVPDNVQTIGQGAFSNCSNLQSITLPFIGGSRETSESFGYVFNNNSDTPASLTHATITGGNLHSYSFSGCQYLEFISLPANDTSIPAYSFRCCNNLTTLIFTDTAEEMDDMEDGYVILPERINSVGYESFYGCHNLKFIQLPDSLTSIEGYAFESCTSMERVEIPESVNSIAWTAFRGCTSVTEYVVDEDNTAYCSDKWGVLYNKKMTTLINYPSARKWPYYNVSDKTTTINSRAFQSCENLVNLYIPNTVTTLDDTCIYSCPGLTICAYSDSTAYTYAGNNNLTAWPMDNYTLQGIEIYSLPEQSMFLMGTEDFDGLYMTADYGGKTLQLDEYELSYEPKLSGVQQVSIQYEGHTETFPIMLFSRTDTLVDFGNVNVPDGTIVLAAVYDEYGQMLMTQYTAVVEESVQIAVPNSIYRDMEEAKLFILDDTSFIPHESVYSIQK